jgi:hypothetical protein
MIWGCGVARPKPREFDDELRAVIEPLLPKAEGSAARSGDRFDLPHLSGSSFGG